MNYNREYVESSIPWVAFVPEDWKIKPIKHNTYIKARVGWKGLTSEEFEVESFAYLITGSDFSAKQIELENCYQISEARYLDDPYIQLQSGDVLLTKDGSIGKVAVVGELDKPACLNSGVFVVRPTSDYTSEYLYWVLKSNLFSEFINLSSSGSTILHLYQNVFEQFAFPLPTMKEQTEIVSFLNHETQELDELISKQQDLISILDERRKALIRQCTTKGLNQATSVQATNVYWLGDVPEHWSVGALKWFAKLQTGSTPSGAESQEVGEIPWVRPDDLLESGADTVASRFISLDAASELKPAPAGATLLCCIGATLGKAGHTVTETYFNQQITSISWKMHPKYLFYLISGLKDAIRSLSVGNTLSILNNEKLGSLHIPVPPDDEQSEIVEYLENKLAQLDKLTKLANQSVGLLIERRQALISAAVTGKIDVRGK